MQRQRIIHQDYQVFDNDGLELAHVLEDAFADGAMEVGYCYYMVIWFVFFFQAEDGIRDLTVTGVQTCALPISLYHELRRHLGEVFRALAEQKECRIEEGHLMADHVHMLLSIPPKYSVAQVVG